MHLHIRTPPAADDRQERALKGAIWALSIFTMAMTVPQVWTIWMNHQAAGVSSISWSAYLISAIAWLGYGIRKRDPTIYVPCFGWILLDAAVVIGATLYG